MTGLIPGQCRAQSVGPREGSGGAELSAPLADTERVRAAGGDQETVLAIVFQVFLLNLLILQKGGG